MSNIEKIRQEIERRKKSLRAGICNDKAFTKKQKEEMLVASEELTRLSRFIDSLPEEKPSDDLEEAADEYADKHGFRVPYDGSNNYYDDVDVKASKEGFLAGAEWQKEQMMEEAVVSEIGYWNQRGLSIRLDKSLERLGYDMDTKVKIIIIKDND